MKIRMPKMPRIPTTPKNNRFLGILGIVGLFGILQQLCILHKLRYAKSLTPPFPVEELKKKLAELQSAINTGKDSL
jgi:hypothetical protein